MITEIKEWLHIKKDGKWNVWKILLIILGVVLFANIINIDTNSYEKYDLKGLTIKEACVKARGAGWEVDEIRHIENYSDKTDCYNDSVVVTNYSYVGYTKEVDIYFGEEKSEESKKAECEATGKWYRDRQCKSEEEWREEYKWREAHSACKKYGNNGYAKTLTDCYVGDTYMGPVGGSPASSTSSGSSGNSSSSSESSNLATSSSSSSSSGSSSPSGSSSSSSQQYIFKNIKEGESCPSNAKFCHIPGNSTGYADYGWGTMRGKIINNSGKNYSYLQITADVYSSAGSKIGDCWGNTSGLAAGGTWEYEAYCDGWGHGVSLKNGDISGW